MSRARETFPPGTVLDGRYRVIDLIGRGPRGAVYHVSDEREREALRSLTVTLALKVLDGAPRGGNLRERYRYELVSRALPAHGSLVRTYDFFDLGGRAVVAMEHVAGRSLASRIEEGPIPPAEAREILFGILKALELLHSHGRVHGSLTPENVLLARSGGVKLSDYGWSGLRERRPAVRAFFTRRPGHEPPELVETGSMDSRGDLYALGVIARRMTRRADRSPDLEHWIRRATAKSLARRHQTTGEATEELWNAVLYSPAVDEALQESLADSDVTLEDEAAPPALRGNAFVACVVAYVLGLLWLCGQAGASAVGSGA